MTTSQRINEKSKNIRENDITHIQSKLKEESDRATTLADRWQNVKRATKKDGDDFAIMSKNFVYEADGNGGMQYKQDALLPKYGEYYLKIWGWTRPLMYRNYVEDEIPCFVNINQYTEFTTREQALASDDVLKVIKSDYYEIAILKPDAVMRRVERKIENLRDEAKSYDEQAKRVEIAYNNFAENLSKALEKLEADCGANGKHKTNTLTEAIKDCFKY